MLWQVRQDLKLGHQSGVELHVEGALHWAACSLRDFALSTNRSNSSCSPGSSCSFQVVLGEVAEGIGFALKSFCAMRGLLDYLHLKICSKTVKFCLKV